MKLLEASLALPSVSQVDAEGGAGAGNGQKSKRGLRHLLLMSHAPTHEALDGLKAWGVACDSQIKNAHQKGVFDEHSLGRFLCSCLKCIFADATAPG